MGRASGWRAHPPNHLQAVLESHTRGQGPHMRLLDRGAVGDRVGEGHAELEGVGPTGDERLDDGLTGVRVGVTDHDEGDEGASPRSLRAANIAG